jgi:protein SCO1/2
LKSIRFILWGLVAVALIGLIVAKILQDESPDVIKLVAKLVQPHHSAPEPTALFEVPPIALTDQDAKPFSTAQLRGGPWVADFIFTSCAGSCPIMSHQMADLQKKTPAGLALVSFTVDPQTDTPAILKEYGQGLHADFSRWHFLTGTRQQMNDAAAGMKIAVHPADKDFALTHSDRFLLINSAGQVVGIYQGTSSQDVARLVEDATRLANSEKPS